MQRYYIKRTYNLAIVFALLVSKQISHSYLKSTENSSAGDLTCTHQLLKDQRHWDLGSNKDHSIWAGMLKTRTD